MYTFVVSYRCSAAEKEMSTLSMHWHAQVYK